MRSRERDARLPDGRAAANDLLRRRDRVKAAIVTCGGLCPGINNVIRTLVFELHYRYGVRSILGIRYGYRGFIPKYGYEPIPLTPDFVKDIHEKGGSILSSSRGAQDTAARSWTSSSARGSRCSSPSEGTERCGAHWRSSAKIKKRGLPISVIGIPKTIDNDIAFVERTFGLETAFSVAAESIRSAHTEAIGAPNGIGIVKVMGRMSGLHRRQRGPGAGRGQLLPDSRGAVRAGRQLRPVLRSWSSGCASGTTR